MTYLLMLDTITLTAGLSMLEFVGDVLATRRTALSSSLAGTVVDKASGGSCEFAHPPHLCFSRPSEEVRLANHGHQSELRCTPYPCRGEPYVPAMRLDRRSRVRPGRRWTPLCAYCLGGTDPTETETFGTGSPADQQKVRLVPLMR